MDFALGEKKINPLCKKGEKYSLPKLCKYHVSKKDKSEEEQNEQDEKKRKKEKDKRYSPASRGEQRREKLFPELETRNLSDEKRASRTRYTSFVLFYPGSRNKGMLLHRAPKNVREEQPTRAWLISEYRFTRDRFYLDREWCGETEGRIFTRY